MHASALMLRQHRKIVARLQALRMDGHRRCHHLAALVDDVTSHFAIEASLIYPLAADMLRSRPAERRSGLVQELRARNARCKSLVVSLASSALSGAAFLERVREIEALFHEHVHTVEGELLPALAQGIRESTMFELGEDMERMSLAMLAKGRARNTYAYRHAG
jgi:hypothetical protein